MGKKQGIMITLLCLILMVPASAGQTERPENKKPKPLEDIADILAWKSIRSSLISNNGAWFAYYLSPQEGDGEAVIRQTKGDKVYRFPAGEAPTFGEEAIAFSADSQWLAYTIYPEREEARKLRKQKKKTYNNVKLLNLTSGDEREFEKVRSFAFSGENPDWIVFHRYPGESQAQEKWEGSDLLLHKLEDGSTLNIGNVSQFAFNKKGDWLAWIVDAKDKIGNGIQFRNMQSGVISPAETGKAIYKRLAWTEKGEGAAVLKGIEDDDYEDLLYSIIGFSDFTSAGPKKTVYTPQEDDDFPGKMTISPNRTPQWTDDFSAIVFGIHEAKEKKDKKEKPELQDAAAKDKPGEKSEDKPEEDVSKPEADIDKEDLPELVIWHWKDKRMQSMQQVQQSRDKNFSYLSVFRVREKKFLRLADDDVRSVSPAPKHRWAIGTDNREYELSGNLEGRRYNDIYVIDMVTGERRLALKRCRWYMSPSFDGTHFLYYQDGHYHTYDMSSGKSYNITKDVPTSFINSEDDHNVIDPPVYSFAWGWTHDGAHVLLYDNWDIWQVPVHGGKGVNLTVNGRSDGIRYRSRFRLDPEEKGIDLRKPIYVSLYGEWTKKAGIGRISNGKPGVERLLWDDANFSLRKAEKAKVYFYTRQTYKDYPDYHVADENLKNARKITDANPQQKEYLWSAGSMLVDYTSDKGDKLQAALFLPAGYEKGESYPTIVYIYEKLSSGLNRYYTPSARGFNKTVYTSRGYAVLMPDIVYTVNDPGMSAVWCVLPAVKAAVATGVVDENRIGLHGHSWGGYQTSFLITQTDLFQAAVAGAPLTNMISMYSSIYWNSGSANQPIFESSQGRFKGNYLENMDAYGRNSPVYFAEKVQTPLIILHNDKDGAVDWNQGIEYFNTLRQLRKSVVMLQYKGENHGLRKAPNQKDYYVRMSEFFDHHLRGKPAPKWLKVGVSHLDHEEHIKARTREILPAKKEEETKKKK